MNLYTCTPRRAQQEHLNGQLPTCCLRLRREFGALLAHQKRVADSSSAKLSEDSAMQRTPRSPARCAAVWDSSLALYYAWRAAKCSHCHACMHGVCRSHAVCCARCRIEAYPGKGSRDKSPVASLVQKYEDENAAPVRQITPSSMLLCGVPTCLLSICEHFKCAQCQALWLEKALWHCAGRRQ